jgi:cyclophilin family peptidyl-prolyl cis-trans isomerase
MTMYKAKKRLLAAFLAVATMFMFSGCAENDGDDEVVLVPPPPSTFNRTLQGAHLGNSEEVVLRNGDTYAVINIRDYGEIKLALFPDIAPMAVNSFVELANSGYYNGKIFHRIIPNFMIQGGSPFGDGRGDPTFRGFDTEASEFATHKYGAISTANTGAPGSNGQQFFIVNAPNGTPHLNGNHSVFGHVIDGFDVLEAVSAVKTGTNAKPLQDVIINYVVIHTHEGDSEWEVFRGNSLRNGDRVEVKLEEGDQYAVIDIRGFGEIQLVFFPEVAPVAVANFIGLAESGSYDGRTFHRIIKNFMIQGGCAAGTGASTPSVPEFDVEFSPHARHLYGAISTANRGPGTNGEQFFIVNAASTHWLNGKHTVFGQVVDGFDVLEAVSSVRTDNGDQPLEKVVINSVRIGTYSADTTASDEEQ